MSTPSRPSTPLKQQTAPSTPVGKWQHPRFDEIYRRQNKTTFTDRNVKKILYNLGGTALLWIIGQVLWQKFPNAFHPGKVFHTYATYTYHIILLLFAFNIMVACWPLMRTKDNIEDIPLTPAQRKLLGLPPSATPPAPGTVYSTPPRYARTPTPMSASPASRGGSLSNSPLSARPSPAAGDMAGSTFSPNASPLFQKAMGGGGGMNGPRRSSYGSPSPLGPGASRMVPETPGTPSPSTKGPSVGLNNRWLYDQARRNSGSSRLYL